MPAKRPDDFKTKSVSVIETKTSLEKRSVDIEENLLSETTNQIGVVTYPEKHETKKEKKHIPAFQLKPDETMHENIEAIKGLLGTNNKTQIVKQAVACYRKKLEKELL